MKTQNLSPFDMAVDILLDRQQGVTAELRRRFRTRPFRQVPVSRKEMLLNYNDVMSREEQLRERFGDTVVNNYIQANQEQLGGK